MAKHIRRPGLDQAEVEAALKEAAWLSIHGTREDKDGIFRGPQLVLPDMEKVRKRLKGTVALHAPDEAKHGNFGEPAQKPYQPEKK